MSETGPAASTRVPQRDPFVVGLGASAGGIEALKQFFMQQPAPERPS